MTVIAELDLAIRRLDWSTMPAHVQEAVMNLQQQLQALLDKMVAGETTIFGSIDGFISAVIALVASLRLEISQMNVPPQVATLLYQLGSTLDSERDTIQAKIAQGTSGIQPPAPADPPPPPPADVPPADTPPADAPPADAPPADVPPADGEPPAEG